MNFDETISQLLLFLTTATGAVVAALWMGIVLWTWRDMRARSRDRLAQGAAALMVTTQKIAKAVKKGLNAPGIMLAVLNGAPAGQSIFHIHFHVIPRTHGVDLGLHARSMVDPKSLEPIAAKIRAAL